MSKVQGTGREARTYCTFVAIRVDCFSFHTPAVFTHTSRFTESAVRGASTIHTVLSLLTQTTTSAPVTRIATTAETERNFAPFAICSRTPASTVASGSRDCWITTSAPGAATLAAASTSPAAYAASTAA